MKAAAANFPDCFSFAILMSDFGWKYLHVCPPLVAGFKNLQFAPQGQGIFEVSAAGEEEEEAPWPPFPFPLPLPPDGGLWAPPRLFFHAVVS